MFDPGGPRQGPKTAVSGEPRCAGVQCAAPRPQTPCLGPALRVSALPLQACARLRPPTEACSARTHFRKNAATQPPHQPSRRGLVGGCLRDPGRRRGALQRLVADCLTVVLLDFIKYVSKRPPKARDHGERLHFINHKTTVKTNSASPLCSSGRPTACSSTPSNTSATTGIAAGACRRVRSTFERRLGQAHQAAVCAACAGADRRLSPPQP